MRKAERELRFLYVMGVVGAFAWQAASVFLTDGRDGAC